MWIIDYFASESNLQEWKANISDPVWWRTFSEFLLLNHFSFNSYWICSVSLLVWFSFLALFFTCRTIRIQLNCTLVRILQRNLNCCSLKAEELEKRSQLHLSQGYLVGTKWLYSSSATLFIRLQQLGSCMCTRGQALCWTCCFYSQIMALLLHRTKIVRSSWSNFPNKRCFFC